VDERHVFRVDHFLAMTTVQNVLGTRLANRVLEPIWNSAHIDEVEIIWEESLGLEGRAGYYDHVGALKDMVQNHLLQLLCLVAMEPPISLGERDLRDRKVDVLRSVRPFEDDDVATRTHRARYRAGRVRDRDIPAYGEEDGVTPEHGTGPSVALSLVPLTLSAEMKPPELPAYGRILLDVLSGNSALSIRADEAEEAWRVLSPVLEGWSRNLAPLREYDAGSNGPPRPPRQGWLSAGERVTGAGSPALVPGSYPVLTLLR
jgi:glucose-6-phosphate 1-dehydrogenase